MGKWQNPALTKSSFLTPTSVVSKRESQEEEEFSTSLLPEDLVLPTCSVKTEIDEEEEENNKENVEVDPPISPIRGVNYAAHSSLALNTPLLASTPLRKKVFPTYSFFSLVTGNEDENDGVSLENNQSPNVLKDKNDSILNTPTIPGRNNTSKSESNKGLSPTGSFMGHLGKENCPSTFLTPPRKSLSEENRVPNTLHYESPVMMKVNFNISASDGDDEYDAGKGRKYHLRPRNLFNSGVSIKPFSMYDDITSDEGVDNDDEDVFFFLQSEDEADEYEYEEVGEKKRSSYSGVRGPKADAKALSLVTNCPVSVKWLVNNFEYYPGRSLPRGFVYDQYVILCNDNTLEPVNAASFGKLIRSVFPGLKTRRLGTRGNSKYHYNGIYLKQSSHLMAILNLIKTKQGLSYEGNGKRGRKVRRCVDAEAESNNEAFRMRDADGFVDCSPEEYLGTKPELNQPFAQLIVDEESIHNTLNINTISTFQAIYFSHCQMLLKHFEKFELRQVFDEWKRFWRLKSNEPADGEEVEKYRDIMSKATLYKVCSLKATQQFIMSMDLSTYQYVIDILFPCFSKGMPITMVNGMRNFLKDVDCFFYKIMEGYPKNMAETKLRCLRVFVLMCNDYSRSNRMLKSAISIIRNEDNIKAMHSELARSINFEEIEKDVQLYKTKSETFLQDTLTLAFHSNLDYRANYTVKSWIYWAQQVSNKLIQERTRQFTSDEIKSEVNPFIIWKKTSDQILGAMVKGNAVSYGTLKSFLAWCDNLIKHITKINTSHAKGFILPVFYYNQILEELEGISQHAPEPMSNNDTPSLRQLIYNKFTKNHASTSAQNPTTSNPVISADTLILSQEQFQVYYDGSMQYVNNIGQLVPLPPPTSQELMEEMGTIQQSSSQQFEEKETQQLPSQHLVEENREIELCSLEQFEDKEKETQQHLGQETPTKLL